MTTFNFPNTVGGQSAWTLSYTNGTLLISDTGGGATFFGYRMDKQ